jgi:hypothetical protein
VVKLAVQVQAALLGLATVVTGRIAIPHTGATPWALTGRFGWLADTQFIDRARTPARQAHFAHEFLQRPILEIKLVRRRCDIAASCNNPLMTERAITVRLPRAFPPNIETSKDETDSTARSGVRRKRR